ncbi:MAG: endonuclease III [Bacteroidales bacterium]|nr:endonuclease III [Bacteroidales bacterium]
MIKKERYDKIIEYFKTHNPNAETELDYHNPFELLVAVILSAQCTDKRVNMVTPDLLKAFPNAQKMSETTADEIFEYIKSISYPNNKAKHLLNMSKRLVEDYGGEVPEDYDALLSLPGVGRKTANVIASVVWNKPKMAVDTHVFRVSNRIGLTDNSKTPLQTEMELVKNFPEEIIPIAHHWLILHGRYICVARTPKCTECGISAYCKSYKMKE